MDQKPSVGRIVHYVSYGTPDGEYGKECRAAIITAVDVEQNEASQADIIAESPDATNIGWVVDLCVLNPEGLFFNRAVAQGPEPYRGGTWHWPERV